MEGAVNALNNQHTTKDAELWHSLAPLKFTAHLWKANLDATYKSAFLQAEYLEFSIPSNA